MVATSPSRAHIAYDAETTAVVRHRILVVAAVYVTALAGANTFEWIARPERRLIVATSYAFELLAFLIALMALREPRLLHQARVIGAALCSVLVGSIAGHVLGSGGPVTRIASSYLCLLTGLVVLVPWGWRAQAMVAGAAAAMLGVSFTVAVPPPDTEDVVHCILVILTMGTVSVLGAHFLDRYRREAFVRAMEVEESAAQLRATATLLEVVRRLQSRFIAAGDAGALFGDLLDDVLAVTESRYGFVAEVLARPTGEPYVRTLAISDIAWNDETRTLYGQFAPHLEFDNLASLFGAVVTTEQAVIANDPATDDRRGGLPAGHPPLDAFLGLPLHHGRELVGMVGIANRPGGYDASIVAYLQPLLALSGSLVAAYRNVHYRQQAESALWTETKMTAALADASGALMSTLEPGEVISHLCQRAVAVLEADLGVAVLVAPGAEEATTVAFAGTTPSEEDFARGIPMPPAAIERVFASTSDCQVVDLGDLPPEVTAKHGLPSPMRPHILCLAIREHGAVMGMQVVVRRTGGAPFSPAHRRIAENLAHVASMAFTNAMLLQDLQRANRTKSEFVSTMSHELRTPLNVILGYAEMTRDLALDDATRTLCLNRIETAGRDLLSLIEDTLEIGRIETHRDEVELAPVALFELWKRLGNTCEHLPHRDDVRLEWTPAPVATFTSDSRKLTVIVRNLVGNALKFTEHGHVHAKVAREGAALHVTVSDTGIGVRPEDQQAIFEMFRQVDGSDRRRFGGTGLGLYIVKRYVEQLGGIITLESALGVGSTFRVTVPAPDAEGLNAAEPPSSEEPGGWTAAKADALRTRSRSSAA